MFLDLQKQPYYQWNDKETKVIKDRFPNNISGDTGKRNPGRFYSYVLNILAKTICMTKCATHV